MKPLKISQNKENLLKKQRDLNGILSQTKKIVEPAIKQVLASYVSKETKKIISYPIETGGKRLRPALTILSCLTCGGKIKEVIYPAAGLEILHQNSLIIDDIIDHSKTRRGEKTCWAKFGKSIAECLSIDYSAAIFQTATFSKTPLLISDIFSRTMKVLIEGEILDILFEQSGRDYEKYIITHRYKRVTEKDYFRMVKLKTSALAMSCCEVGAVSAKASKRQIKALKNYGKNLGIAFQVTDDILDIFGDPKKFGKKIGKDIGERKLGNIVIYFALKELLPKERKQVFGILRKRQMKKKNITKAISLIKKTKAKEKATDLAEKYVRKAKKNLEELPQNKWIKLLGELADFVIEREY